MHAGGEQAAAPAALDPALARGLWEVSVRETGLSAAQDDALWPSWGCSRRERRKMHVHVTMGHVPALRSRRVPRAR
jgi:hypothetical protein